MKAVILWIVIIIGVFLLWSLFQTTKGTTEIVSFSTFLDRVNRDEVARVLIRGNELVAVTRDTAKGGRQEFRVVVPSDYPPMYDLMRAKGVDIELQLARDSPFITTLITWAPVIALIWLWIYLVRRIKRPVPPPLEPPVAPRV